MFVYTLLFALTLVTLYILIMNAGWWSGVQEEMKNLPSKYIQQNENCKSVKNIKSCAMLDNYKHADGRPYCGYCKQNDRYYLSNTKFPITDNLGMSMDWAKTQPLVQGKFTKDKERCDRNYWVPDDKKITGKHGLNESHYFSSSAGCVKNIERKLCAMATNCDGLGKSIKEMDNPLFDGLPENWIREN